MFAEIRKHLAESQLSKETQLKRKIKDLCQGAIDTDKDSCLKLFALFKNSPEAEVSFNKTDAFGFPRRERLALFLTEAAISKIDTLQWENRDHQKIMTYLGCFLHSAFIPGSDFNGHDAVYLDKAFKLL